MKKTIFVLLCIILLCAGATTAAQAQATPRFEDYRATRYRGKFAPVNLRSAEGASTFRTRLREGASGGVNFAGRYALVSWGCGTGCMMAGIIDAKTGTVYFPKELGGFGVWMWEDNGDVMQFKPNSRLLVVSGWPATEADQDNPKTGIYYYEWTGTRLRLVKYVARSREEGR